MARRLDWPKSAARLSAVKDAAARAEENISSTLLSLEKAGRRKWALEYGAELLASEYVWGRDKVIIENILAFLRADEQTHLSRKQIALLKRVGWIVAIKKKAGDNPEEVRTQAEAYASAHPLRPYVRKIPNRPDWLNDPSKAKLPMKPPTKGA